MKRGWILQIKFWNKWFKGFPGMRILKHLKDFCSLFIRGLAQFAESRRHPEYHREQKLDHDSLLKLKTGLPQINKAHALIFKVLSD